MLALVIDLFAAFLIAKYLRSLWSQIPLAILMGIVSPILANFLAHFIMPTEITEGDAVLRGVTGILTHTLIVLGGLWYFRRKARLLNQSGSVAYPVAPVHSPLAYERTVRPATNFAKETSSEINSTIPLQAIVDENSVYVMIANELESGILDKGLWTRLFAECGGDERQVKVRYIKERVGRIIAEQVHPAMNTKKESPALPMHALENSRVTATVSPTTAPVFSVPNQTTTKQKLKFCFWRPVVIAALLWLSYATHITIFFVICLPILIFLIATWPRHPLPPVEDSNCPLCGGQVNSEAKQCRHCNTAFIGTISPKHMNF